MGSEPGFVLVHGAGLGAWIWDPLIARLSRPALAIDLPGRGSRPAPRRSVGMSAAIEAVAAEARAWGDRPLVLVGHSLGGVVALGAAAELGPRVQRVVLVGGGAVPSGMSYFAALPTRDRWALKLAAALRIPAPAAAVRKVLCHDLDDDTAELVVERTALPEPWRMYGEKVHWDALSRSVPMTYVKLLQDRAVSPALQERFASYLRRPDVLTIDSGHLPMLGSRLPTLATALEPA